MIRRGILKNLSPCHLSNLALFVLEWSFSRAGAFENENVATTVGKIIDAKCGICTPRMDTSASMALASLSLRPCEFLVVMTMQRSLLRYENYRRRFTLSFVASTTCISIPWLDFQVQS